VWSWRRHAADQAGVRPGHSPLAAGAISLAIDRALAERGRQLFDSPEIGCSGCHGRYDGAGNVDWPGVHVDVGTDRARLDVVNDGFIAAFDSSPLAAEGSLAKSRGYAATPLTGVWANFPYLHNGSVPTLHHLLGPVAERPRIFHVQAARRFERARGSDSRSMRPRRTRGCRSRSSSPDLARTVIGSSSREKAPATPATTSGGESRPTRTVAR
jgi:hypothetical protein